MGRNFVTQNIISWKETKLRQWKSTLGQHNHEITSTRGHSRTIPSLSASKTCSMTYMRTEGRTLEEKVVGKRGRCRCAKGKGYHHDGQQRAAFRPALWFPSSSSPFPSVSGLTSLQQSTHWWGALKRG